MTLKIYTMKTGQNISWSFVKKHLSCGRNAYYNYDEKPEKTDKVEEKWGNFGNCVHESLEHLNKFPSKLEAAEFYHIKYNLGKTEYTIQNVIDNIDYGLFALKEIGKEVTHNEQVIILPHKIRGRDEDGNIVDKTFNMKSIIDVTLEDGSILDWKTSTFKTKSVNEYIRQGKFYCWVTWLSTGKFPPFFYLVFNKEKKYFKYDFTDDEILEFGKEMEDAIYKISTLTGFKDHKHNVKSCFFCPWKKKCAADSIKGLTEVTFFLKIKRNRVYIANEFIDPDLQDVLDSVFSYEMDNKHFAIKAMRAKGNKDFDGIVRMFSRKTNSAPLGFLEKMTKILKDYGAYKKLRVIVDTEDLRQKTITYTVHLPQLCNVTMRPYQELAVEQILGDKICLADLCTGAGKTVIACEVIRRSGKETLFIVDEKALLLQSQRELSAKLGCRIGTITNGKMNNQMISVATIQTINSLLKKKDLEFRKYLSRVGCIIIDEAHGAKAKSYKKLLDVSNSEYIIGLTGTAYVDGNSSLELYRSFGFPKVNIKAIDLINTGYLQAPTVQFHKYKTEELILEGDYNEVYNQIVLSKRRFHKIIDIIKENRSTTILIIVNRIAHGELIKDFLNHYFDIESPFICGALKGESRDEVIQDMKAGNSNVVIGMSKIVQKGLDIPNLGGIINVTANLGSTFTIQSVGRGLRKAEGKKTFMYWDFYDTNETLISHTKARINQFRNQGYDIDFTEDLE